MAASAFAEFLLRRPLNYQTIAVGKYVVLIQFMRKIGLEKIDSSPLKDWMMTIVVQISCKAVSQLLYTSRF
ncbi:hypothetical protein Mapa_009419 [Marchantia paleacea]|nr:hypothetical protein Mapa_009419 [Marchantia paleacea]